MYLFIFKSNKKMQIKIHNEGKIFFFIFLILTIFAIPFSLISGIFLLTITIYIYYFFRDPDRSIPVDDFIVSPADGKITYIGFTDPPTELNINEKFIKISIFLNIFNVHVNRMPTDGIVKKIDYIHGKFINASLDKSSKDNERNIITINKDNKDIFIITQIAGLIARRIVCNVKENQRIFRGGRFGIIKFGSRVDLYLPKNYKPLVSVGQTVIGGETIIANPNNIQELTKSLKN
jgi:phosphatidylserine decarboxylase